MTGKSPVLTQVDLATRLRELVRGLGATSARIVNASSAVTEFYVGGYHGQYDEETLVRQLGEVGVTVLYRSSAPQGAAATPWAMSVGEEWLWVRVPPQWGVPAATVAAPVSPTAADSMQTARVRALEAQLDDQKRRIEELEGAKAHLENMNAHQSAMLREAVTATPSSMRIEVATLTLAVFPLDRKREAERILAAYLSDGWVRFDSAYGFDADGQPVTQIVTLSRDRQDTADFPPLATNATVEAVPLVMPLVTDEDTEPIPAIVEADAMPSMETVIDVEPLATPASASDEQVVPNKPPARKPDAILEPGEPSGGWRGAPKPVKGRTVEPVSKPPMDYIDQLIADGGTVEDLIEVLDKEREQALIDDLVRSTRELEQDRRVIDDLRTFMTRRSQKHPPPRLVTIERM